MDKKAFKQKIENNRNKAFGDEKKKYDKKPQQPRGERKPYTPKTTKPKPTTYEATFDNVVQALAKIKETSSELRGFVDYIYDFDQPLLAMWFDNMIYKVGEYMLKRTPQLLQKRNIHAKYTISVNGFSIKTEDNIGLEFNVKYTVEDNNIVLGDVHCAITVYGKVSPSTTIMLEESDVWKKKEFRKKPAAGNFYKKPYNKERNNSGYKKPYNNDKKSYIPREY